MVLYANIKGLAPSSIGARVDFLLKMLDIESFRKVQSKKLSGGTKRKLSVCIAMIAAPQVMYLDEPSAGLDVDAKVWKKKT